MVVFLWVFLGGYWSVLWWVCLVVDGAKFDFWLVLMGLDRLIGGFETVDLSIDGWIDWVDHQ